MEHGILSGPGQKEAAKEIVELIRRLENTVKALEQRPVIEHIFHHDDPRK